MKLSIKKMFYLTAVAVSACVIASCTIAALTTEPEKKIVTSSMQRTEERDTYVLTEKNGRIVAYIKGVEIPYIETTTAVNSLPYDVQEKLRKGIEFETLDELKAVMNEYCS